MLSEVTGIVLRESDYKESSKLVQLLTKEYGLIRVLAKGAKNLKSDLRNPTTKLTYGTFYIYYKEDKLSTLVNVDVISYFQKLKTDIEKISYASYLLELSEQVMKENESCPMLELLISALQKMEEGFSPLLLTNILELKALAFLGVMPVLDGCSACGRKTSIATLSSSRGGYICNQCLTNERIVSEKAIKLIRLFYYVEISKISKLDVSIQVQREINTFLEEYYDRYTGLYLKSKQFLNTLNQVM